MKRLIIAAIVALIVGSWPIATQPWANDAHHPEKAAKGKKATKEKTKQKQPAAKTDKSKDSEMRFGPQGRKV